MPFPFEFVRKTGDYDFFSPVINLAANAAVIAVGGVSIGAVSYIALKALGFSSAAVKVTTAIPLFLGVAGVTGVIVAGIAFAIMVSGVRDTLSRR